MMIIGRLLSKEIIYSFIDEQCKTSDPGATVAAEYMLTDVDIYFHNNLQPNSSITLLCFCVASLFHLILVYR